MHTYNLPLSHVKSKNGVKNQYKIVSRHARQNKTKVRRSNMKNMTLKTLICDISSDL